MGEHRAPQVGNDALTDAHHQIEAHIGRAGQHDCNRDDARQCHIEHRRIAAAESGINDKTQPLTQCQHAARSDQQRHHRNDNAGTVRHKETQQAAQLRYIALGSGVRRDQ